MGLFPCLFMAYKWGVTKYLLTGMILQVVLLNSVSNPKVESLKFGWVKFNFQGVENIFFAYESQGSNTPQEPQNRPRYRRVLVHSLPSWNGLGGQSW